MIVGALNDATLGKETALAPSTLAALRHLTSMLLGRWRKRHLRIYLSNHFGVGELAVEGSKRNAIEGQNVDIRHTVIAWSAWLLCSARERFGLAINDRAVRYNHFFRDFDKPPQWYVESLQGRADSWMRPHE